MHTMTTPGPTLWRYSWHGAIALLIAATFGAGLVAQGLFAPDQFNAWPWPKLLLLAFALTSPSLAFACLSNYAKLPTTWPSEIRERAAIANASISCLAGQMAAWIVAGLSGSSWRQLVVCYVVVGAAFAVELVWRLLRRPTD